MIALQASREAGAGDVEILDVSRWSSPATTGERELLGRGAPPVLDVGCGPGRLVAALAAEGVPVLGIDTAPSAVAAAQRLGLAVLDRSVFEPVPGQGRWGTVVVLDGNVGIGGDPVRLLARCGQLMAPAGRLLVEVGPPGSRTDRGHARLVGGEASPTPWFPWAWVGVEGLPHVATAAGLRVSALSRVEHRWFAWLGAPPA